MDITIYDGKVTLSFDPVKHRYEVNGERYYGVTSVFKYAPNKPSLVNWAARVAGELVKDRLVPGVALDELQINDLVRATKNAHIDNRDSAADAGTDVHAWAEAYAKGENPPHPVNEKMAKATRYIQDFFEKNEVSPIHVERPLVSLEYKLAGTPDLVAHFNGKLAIIDWKTGSGIYSTMPRQLGAYSLMYREEFGERPEHLIIINAGVRNGKNSYWINQTEVEDYEEMYVNCHKIREDELLLEKQLKKINK